MTAKTGASSDERGAGGDDVEGALGARHRARRRPGSRRTRITGISKSRMSSRVVSSGLTSRPVTYTSAPRARAAAMRSKVALWPSGGAVQEDLARRRLGRGQRAQQRRLGVVAVAALVQRLERDDRREAAQLAAAAGDHASCRRRRR